MLCEPRNISVCLQSFTKEIQLFVTSQSGDQDKAAGKVTMATWLQLAIQEAYESINLPSPDGVKAHTIQPDISRLLGLI